MKSSSVYLLMAIIFCMIVIFILSSNLSESKKTISAIDKNILALSHSVDVYKNKNGVMISERRQLVSSIEELKKLDKDLYDQLMKAKGKGGSVIDGTHTIIKFDTIYVLKPIVMTGINIDTTVVDTISDSAVTSIISIPVKASTKDSVITVKLDSIKVTTDIDLGVTVVHTRKNIFSPYQMTSVSTTDSRFHVTNVSSWDKLDKPKPRIVLRPGLTAAIIYDPFDQGIKVGIGGGAVLTIIKK